MVLQEQQELRGDCDAVASHCVLRAVVAGLVVPGGGFIFGGFTSAGLIVMVAVAAATRVDAVIGLTLWAATAVAAGGYVARRGVTDAVPSGVVGLLALFGGVAVAALSGMPIRSPMSGFGQVGMRFVSRAVAFEVMSAVVDELRPADQWMVLVIAAVAAAEALFTMLKREVGGGEPDEAC